ncbi:MAG: DUF697 domain-containing protein [Gammaproteobacteria bacterium SHHR-1]|uniref:DUF697 domain-containing protein n=1 Tax=Magnetovirga frankeli TaxID=947516 RepID=UPI001293898F|nr:DUF697 domain-containing protein [gamma proteobacterium SS-5]
MTTAATEKTETDLHAKSARVIASAVKWSAAAAVVPVPYVDLLALASVQVKMVRDLARVHGQDAGDETLPGVISALLGTLVPASLSTGLLGSSLKVIPGGGSLIGSLGMAAFASASTFAIGKIFVIHFAKGGTLSNFSAEAVEDDLKKEFSAAKAK